jgi:hypothetical protein
MIPLAPPDKVGEGDVELPLNICAGCINLGFLQCSVREAPLLGFPSYSLVSFVVEIWLLLKASL